MAGLNEEASPFVSSGVEWQIGSRSFLSFLSILLIVFLFPVLAFGQNDNWVGGAGNWSNGNMWSLGAPPSSSQNANIDNGNAKASAVTLDINGQCGNLTVDSDDSLNFNNLTSLTVSGGTISNAGNISINGGNANSSVLNLGVNTSLQGGGAVTLTSSGGNAIIQGAGFTLTNTNNTIQGWGTIGNGSLALSNAGTVDANQSTGTLFLNGTGGITNTKLLEATNGGVLEIENTVNNSGGNITANGAGSQVQLASADIQGGTLNSLNNGTLEAALLGCSNSVTLDGSTHGALTLSTGSTYTNPDQTTNLLGTINNSGNFQVNGFNACASTLNLTGNTTLQGGGTVTLSSSGGTAVIQGNGLTLTNTSNTIQGLGIIGNGSLALSNAGTVNANQSPGPNGALLLNGAGGITNTNLLEATNGSVLQIGNTVNNAIGNITANGGTVSLASADIQGGTLNSLNSGTLEAALLGCSNSVTLDGSTHGALTLSTGSTYTNPDQTTNLLGTINNSGNFQVNGFNDCSSTLNLAANTSLQGGGSVTLNSNGGNAIIQGSGFTLTNTNNTIQGLGYIGNGSLALNNAGTVNANVAPPPNQGLFLNGTGGITNTNLLEATSGGLLEIENTVNNSGGTITANGSTSQVQLLNADIQGGTLNSLNSGTLEAALNGCSNSVTLDGSTHGALTLSTGSTYTNPDQTTNLLGTINNNGNFQLNGFNACNSVLNLSGNTTLQGRGKVTLSGSGGTSVIQGSGFTLTNTSNTIQGWGIFGNGSLNLVNGTAGTIYANTSGQTLLLNASGTITNHGTFKVAAGSALHVTNGPFANFSGTTLTGGTYNSANMLQIDQLGTSGGEIITNSAKIILTGTKGTIVDQSNNNALPKLATNTKTGSLSLMSGNLLTTAGSVSNAGRITVALKSALKTGSGSYTQTAGTTTVDGTLTAPAGVAIQAGTLFGKGVISSTVVSSGSVTAGDSIKKAGKLSMSTYTQNSGASLNIQIGGTTVGTQYSQLAVSNGVSLNGTLNLNLINSFVPAIGNIFTILTGSAITGKFATVNGLIINSGECFQVTYGGTSVTLTVESGTGCTNGQASNWPTR